MIGDGGVLRERQGMGWPRPQAGGGSGAARGPNGPQPMDGGTEGDFRDEDILGDELISKDESAKGAIMGLFFTYPEKKAQIWNRVRELWGRPIPEIEFAIVEELEAEKTTILADRAGRERVLMEQGTQAGVVPFTRHEARLAAAAEKRNRAQAEAEEGGESWLQKKKHHLQHWWLGHGKK